MQSEMTSTRAVGTLDALLNSVKAMSRWQAVVDKLSWDSDKPYLACGKIFCTSGFTASPEPLLGNKTIGVFSFFFFLTESIRATKL